MKFKWNYDYFTRKFKHMPEQIQLVCVGTTQAHFALDFSDYAVRAFNMAVWLNSFGYCRLLLDKYKIKIAHGATILISLPYPIFLCSEKDPKRREHALQYSKILFGRDPNVSVMRQCVYRLLPDSLWRANDFAETQRKAWRNRKINHFKPWELELLVKNVKAAWEQETRCEGLDLCGGCICQHCKDRVSEGVGHVIELVDFCKKSGWVPILVSLPFSKVMNEEIPDTFKDLYFYRCINDIVEKTGCRWLDYSQDKRLENINYYMDVWWMNERGRKRFTKILLEDCGML